MTKSLPHKRTQPTRAFRRLPSAPSRFTPPRAPPRPGRRVERQPRGTIPGVPPQSGSSPGGRRPPPNSAAGAGAHADAGGRHPGAPGIPARPDGVPYGGAGSRAARYQSASRMRRTSRRLHPCRSAASGGPRPDCGHFCPADSCRSRSLDIQPGHTTHMACNELLPQPAASDLPLRRSAGMGGAVAR